MFSSFFFFFALEFRCIGVYVGLNASFIEDALLRLRLVEFLSFLLSVSRVGCVCTLPGYAQMK